MISLEFHRRPCVRFWHERGISTRNFLAHELHGSQSFFFLYYEVRRKVERDLAARRREHKLRGDTIRSWGMFALIRAGMLPRLRSNICAATSRGSNFREKENRATTREASWDPKDL